MKILKPNRPILKIALENLSIRNQLPVSLLLNSDGLEHLGYSLNEKVVTQSFLYVRINDAVGFINDNFKVLIERAEAIKFMLEKAKIKSEIIVRVSAKTKLFPIPT